ncbi:tetratricopeptide repeat protein [Dictyobacter aurantiacus]|uniref:HTH cro/C1-type domain-containing protein n=1 Tax=Dictyobacter aurantiacus TaxID=1936993 RepID=A0A401ZAP2_9CHLR|nr:tetratricopeptide repeat protein [Dictyobacter aurantiacus]GCE03937.1 hypothetical protein KDAU_12660 [Dictyobacter aurantiacus]
MPTSETPHQPRVRLTEARVSYNLSQQEVADEIGTTYVNVSRWERGITRPNPYFRRKLCALFNKSEEELDLLQTRSERGKGGRSSAPNAPTTVAAPVAPRVIYDPAIPLLPAIPLVGREKDLAVIRQRLKGSGNMALTALNGLPGVGKTALSVALAHDGALREFFKDGILWAGLGPQPNLPGIFSRWGNLLGISFAEMTKLGSDEARAKAIRNAIGDRAMLIIIDDAWKLEEALAFRVGGSHCAHLVTTRFPNIASHMALGNAINIRELGENESISLLNLLAPQVIYREQQKVHDLVQAVGGLPLALTLIGNYLRKQAYSGPARRITSALERLSNAEVRLKLKEPHIPAESHPSLPNEQSLSIQSIIAVTDQLLDEETRRALYALSVFPPKPNTFSEEAAMAVAACCTDELDALSDAGMLESNGERYLLHQVISDYALLQISDEQLTTAQERLVTYYTNYVEEHKKDYELLEEESDTIFSALETALEQDQRTELVKGIYAFAPFLILRGLYAKAQYYLERANELAIEENNVPGIIGTYSYLGEVQQKQGNYVQAEMYYQKGLELARQNNQYEQVCSLLTGLGGVTLRRGEFVKAEAYLQEGLTIARQIQHQEHLYTLLKILGPVTFSQGNYVQAEIYLQEGLKLAQQIGDREQICFLLTNLGVASGLQGKREQAEKYFLEALKIARQIGHNEQVCVLLINLGEKSIEDGDYNQAKVYFQEGLTLSKSIKHREWTSVILGNLGNVEEKQGNYSEAQHYLREGLELAYQVRRPQITGTILYHFGNLYIGQQQIDQAEKAFHEMISTVPLEDKELHALAQYGIARVLALRNNYIEALKLGEDSFKTLSTISNRHTDEVGNWLTSLRLSHLSGNNT